MTIHEKGALLYSIWMIAEGGYRKLEGDGMFLPKETVKNHEIIDEAIEEIRKEMAGYACREEAPVQGTSGGKMQ